MNKILLDTNVLIYAIDENSRYYEQSQSIINNDKVDLFTTSKNISEFLSVVTRSPYNLLSIENALTIVRDISDLATVLFPTTKSFSFFSDLLKKYQPTGLRIHDFEIISIALAHRISSIATFNTKDFKTIEEINLQSF